MATNSVTTENSPEYVTLVECTSMLIDSLVSDVNNIGTELFSKNFLSESDREVLQTGVEPSKKASRMIDAVRMKIKVNPKRFDDFVDILVKQGDFMADSVQKVKEVYKEKVAMRPSADNTVHLSFKCHCGGCTLKTFLKDGCPKFPRVSQASKQCPQFPFLNTAGLRKAEKEMLEVRLLTEVEKIKESFADFCVSISQSHFEYPIEDIKVHLLITINTFSTVEKAEIKNAKTIRDIVIAVSDHISFFNYDLMGQIITKYAPTDEPLLNKYLAKFRAYCERNVFEVPPTVYHYGSRVDPEDCFALKYSLESSVSLNRIKFICIQVASILRIDTCNLRLLSIEDGCLLLSFAASRKMFPFSSEQESLLNKIGLKHKRKVSKKSSSSSEYKQKKTINIPKTSRTEAKNNTGGVPILRSVLPEMTQYLDVDLILMYMYRVECLTTDDYDRLMRIRDTGSSKVRMCHELVVLIERKKFYDQFRKALEDSKVQHSGHEDLLNLIMEKEIEAASEEPTPKPPTLIVNTDEDAPLEDFREGPYPPPGQLINPPTSADAITQNTTANQVEDQSQEAPRQDKASISSFLRGSLCTGLIVIVLFLAGSGIALMYYAVEGWKEKVNCNIKSGSRETDNSDADTEESSIFAFNFISGFLCLVIPTVFLLLLIYTILQYFKEDTFNKSVIRKVLIIVIISYIAVCILVGLAQLALSIYVATLIYPTFNLYRNVTMPMPGLTFECDEVAYLSAFISLTATYILIFVLLAVLVGLFIRQQVMKYFHVVVDEWFTACFKAFSRGSASDTSERQRRNTSTSIALVEANDETPL